MAIRVSADIGGTFTDLQFLNTVSGELHEYKTPSTPADPAEGLFRGITEASEQFGFGIGDVDLVLHGTTIATNAVLERKIAPGAMLTTAGFEDVLEIGRHMRKDVYGLHAERRSLLIKRSDRFGVVERIDAKGNVVEPLDEARVAEVAREIVRRGIPVVAIGFLNAFRNPAHEIRAREIFAEAAPGLIVSISSDISPEIREYERFSTTALNAMLIPVVSNYVSNLQRRSSENSLAAPVLLLQSNGGTSGAAQASTQPAKLLLSGPCGGTAATEQLSTTLGLPNLVSLDLGGTSCDIAVIENGRASTISDAEVDGLAVRLPMVDIRTIGAGGGSIAQVDRTGRLRVGPESAGARPGPACYRRGGTLPTVTDANVVLGRLDPEQFLGGGMALDVGLAEEAVRKHVAQPLDLGLIEAAEGIIAVAISNMVAATRLSLFERGLDPEDFALVSFGGAAGLHAVDVAAELGMRKVIFPRSASTFSAYGMLWCDVLHDVARSSIEPFTNAALARVRGIAATLEQEVNALLQADGIPQRDRVLSLSVDLRYQGQGFEIGIPLTEGPLSEKTIGRAIADFHARHEQLYSHSMPHQELELVTVRMSGRGLLAKPKLRAFEPGSDVPAPARRRVMVDGRKVEIPVYRRDNFDNGTPGPLLICESYTSIFVPRGWGITLLSSGDIECRQEQ